MEKSLEDLNRLSERLAGLLKDPHPGLVTWNGHMYEVLRDIANLVERPRTLINAALLREALPNLPLVGDIKEEGHIIRIKGPDAMQDITFRKGRVSDGQQCWLLEVEGVTHHGTR